MRWTKATSVAAALLIFAALPAEAQRTDGTNVGIGRQGAGWQTQMRNQQDAIKKLETDLAKLDRDGWTEKALAWIEYDFSADNGITVADSDRVADLDPGKKAEVEQLTWDPPTWGVSWTKKPPRMLKLVLTDTAATKIDCTLNAKKKMDGGYMGIFLLDEAIVCLIREPFPESDDGEPAA